MHVAMPTPTEATAIERSKAFRARIAEAAERLAESKRPAPKPVALEPEAIPAEPDPPPCLCSRCAALISDPRPYLTVDKIQRAVAAFFRVTVRDMRSARRTAEIVLPRQIAVYLSRHLTARSLPDIGRRFGGRDHTTALSSIRKITRLVYCDPEIAWVVATLTRELEGEPA